MLTPEFGEWWAAQHTRTRDAIRKLRNAELKRGVQLTRRKSRFRFPGFIRVHEDGTVTVHREDGSEIESGPRGVEVAATETESRWDFHVQGLEERPVQEVLDTVYKTLDAHVLPTAERLLRE
jgi:hypothetical protein